MTTDKTQGGGAVVVASVTPMSNKKKSEKKMTAGRSASGTNGKNGSCSPASNNVNINVNVMHPNHHGHGSNNKNNQNGHWNNQLRQHHRHNNNKNNPNYHPHGNFHHQQGGNGNGNGYWNPSCNGNNVPPQFWNPHHNGGMMMPMNSQGYVPGFVPPSHGPNGNGYGYQDAPYYPPHHQQQEMYYGTAVVAQGFVAPMMAMGQFMAHNQNFGGHGGGYGGGGYDGGSYYGPNDGSFYPMNMMNQCYDEQGYMMDPAAYEYDQEQQPGVYVEQEQAHEPDQQPPAANDDDNLKNNQSDYQYSTPQKASGATTASWEEDDTTMASTFATTQTQNGDEDDVASNTNSNKHKEEEEEDPIDQDVVVQQLFPPLESIQWQLPPNDCLNVVQHQQHQQLNLDDDHKKTLLLGCKTLVKIRDATITLTDPNAAAGNAPSVDMTLSQFLMLERDLELTFFDTPKVLKTLCEEQQRLLDANNNNNNKSNGNSNSNNNKKPTKKQHKKQLQALEQIMNVAQTIVNHLDLAMHVMDLARFQFYAGGNNNNNNNNKATPLPKITHYTPPTVRFLLRDYVDAETGQPNGRLASAKTTLERLRRDLHLETYEDCHTLPRWGCTNLLFQFSALQWLDNPHVRTRLQELSAAHVIPAAFLNYVPYSKRHTTETSQGLVAIYLGLVSPSHAKSFRIRNLPWMANRPVWVDHHHYNNNSNNNNNVMVENKTERSFVDDKTTAEKTQTKEEGPAAVSNNKKNKEDAQADENDKTEDGQLSYSEEQFPPLPAASAATATEPNNGNKNNNNKPKKYFHRGKKNRKAKKKTEQKEG